MTTLVLGHCYPQLLPLQPSGDEYYLTCHDDINVKRKKKTMCLYLVIGSSLSYFYRNY